MLWRRSYDTPPPEIARDDTFSQADDPRYAGIEGGPLTECLADVVARLIPYYQSDIQRDLDAGRVVLVTAHGNSLRALVKHLEGISDTDIAALNIPTGIPLRYDFQRDGDGALRVRGKGEYLDAEAAAAGAAAVSRQGAG